MKTKTEWAIECAEKLHKRLRITDPHEIVGRRESKQIYQILLEEGGFVGELGAIKAFGTIYYPDGTTRRKPMESIIDENFRNV